MENGSWMACEIIEMPLETQLLGEAWRAVVSEGGPWGCLCRGSLGRPLYQTVWNNSRYWEGRWEISFLFLNQIQMGTQGLKKGGKGKIKADFLLLTHFPSFHTQSIVQSNQQTQAIRQDWKAGGHWWSWEEYAGDMTWSWKDCEKSFHTSHGGQIF